MAITDINKPNPKEKENKLRKFLEMTALGASTAAQLDKLSGNKLSNFLTNTKDKE